MRQSSGTRISRPRRAPSNARIALSLLLIIGVAAYFTVTFLPQTFGTLVDREFTSAARHTFQVQLGLDEDWHVRTWTNHPDTEYEISLVGRPVITYYTPKPGVLAPDTFAYNWTLILRDEGSYVAYEFDVKVPLSVFGNEWLFELIVEGFGTLHVTITKFERASFFVFLIIDVAAAISLAVLLVRWARSRRPLDNVQRERE